MLHTKGGICQKLLSTRFSLSLVVFWRLVLVSSRRRRVGSRRRVLFFNWSCLVSCGSGCRMASWRRIRCCYMLDSFVGCIRCRCSCCCRHSDVTRNINHGRATGGRHRVLCGDLCRFVTSACYRWVWQTLLALRSIMSAVLFCRLLPVSNQTGSRKRRKSELLRPPFNGNCSPMGRENDFQSGSRDSIIQSGGVGFSERGNRDSTQVPI